MILLLGWDHWCGCVIELVTTADDRLNVLLQVWKFHRKSSCSYEVMMAQKCWKCCKIWHPFSNHLFFFLDLALQTLFRVSLNWWWLSAKKYFHHENILFSNFVQVIFYTHHKVCDQISAKRRDYIIKCVCVHILQHSIKWDGYTCGLFVINIH